MSEPAIVVNNISKSFRVYRDRSESLKDFVIHRVRRDYEIRRVIDDISFEINRGEAVGLVGHNGCGKSTTLKMLTRIMYPDSGSIKIDGRVSSLIELGAGFHPDMSGRENIYINAAIFGLKKEEIDKRIAGIIDFSELHDYIDNPVRTYSSGMYMRLAFSVAINVDADVLLIDEILAVGDANFQAKCFDKLKSLKSQGVTIVIVSHDMDAMKKFCDRCIWINDGVIAGIGDAMSVVDAYLAEMSVIRNKQMYGSNKPAYAFDNTDDHFGNAKVVISRLEMLNSQKEETVMLDADEVFFLRYHYKVNDNPGKMIVGMGIFTLDGEWIYGTNSSMNGGTEIKVNDDGGIVEMQCSPLHLMDGEYRLQVSVIEQNSDPMDYHQDYMHFRVTSKALRTGVGIVYYDTTWKVIA